MNDWPDHAIWWHLYPLGALNAERTPTSATTTHRLARLEPWLDYAIELGCSGLLLGPVFASETHGYDTIDHYRIDPRLGDDGDFDALITAAHARGLRVVLDGVFNHVARGFPRFAEALRDGPRSEAARWFCLHWPSDGGSPRPECFEGHDHLVTLNHDEPRVRHYVAQVMRHWCARGVDGWRLDAAYAVPPEFWQAVLAEVRPHHPQAWFLGEVLHGDYADYVARSGLDSVTQYELWKALWSSANDRNFFELAWALERHQGFSGTFLPQTFVGNHDVTRIASQLHDERHLGHVLTVLFTVAGSPSIYYGDEQAFRGVKEHRAGGDDAVRPALPDHPSELAEWGWPCYRMHQELIALRRRHPWLARSHCEVAHLSNEQLALRLRAQAEHDDEILVVLNLADAPAQLTGDRLVTRAMRCEAGRLAPGPELQPGCAVSVPAHGWAVLAADKR